MHSAGFLKTLQPDGKVLEENLTITHTLDMVEVMLHKNGVITSAFKIQDGKHYSFLSMRAKELWSLIEGANKLCKAKNGSPAPFKLGTVIQYNVKVSKREFTIQKYMNEVVGISSATDSEHVYTSYIEKSNVPAGIQYVPLTIERIRKRNEDGSYDTEQDIPVRTVEEIALTKKSVAWLKGKKYYIINDEETAEKIFDYCEACNKEISYDTETSGLRINMFGKINSEHAKELAKYNEEHPNDKIKADYLVGIIFCVEVGVSYYFPVRNRKFKNLYEDVDNPIRKRIIENIKAKYTVGAQHTNMGDMARLFRETPADELTCDVILMERVRNILEKGHIVAHNGAYEWKVGWLYEIDTNLRDDTMIMHQIMYKFRSTRANKGEPSNLKHLALVEFGIEQWELSDFFPGFEEEEGAVRKKKGAKSKKKIYSLIDFSYMDYEGSRIYAPADGDVTLMLYHKYKTDMIKNYPQIEYIYSAEIIVACAIAYMEFYGHRIDESKVIQLRDYTSAEIISIESQIRQMVNYAEQEEIDAYEVLKIAMQKHSEDDSNKENHEAMNLATENLKKAIAKNEEHVLNLASPGQVAVLFYDIMHIPFKGEKKSVAKKEIKGLIDLKDEDGKILYPIVGLYSEYKKKDTLVTKFFDNLPYFMYPGGFIFSSYGQINTATGRMSCRQPNAQQYPKAVTKIIVPRDNCVHLDSDYSQIEYRVLVKLGAEKSLAEKFKDPDNDYHTMMASLMYGVPYENVTPKMRGDAKSFNFGIPYGMGFASLAILLTGRKGRAEIEEAKEKYELYFKDQPNIRQFFVNVKEQVVVTKFTETYWGRRRYYAFEDKDGNYSQARKAMAQRQAGNAIIQGTAADIFKISVARCFLYIRKYKLFGLLMIINLVHDEILFEMNVKQLNALRVLSDVANQMQFEINDFPPLFIGAGIDKSWAEAKDKMAEIHPHLLDTLCAEGRKMNVMRSDNDAMPGTPKEVVAYFADRVYQFRLNKVRDYMLNPDNWGQPMHPAIGGIVNLQFTYGIKNKHADGSKMSDSEYMALCLEEFIRRNNMDGITPEHFAITAQHVDIEEDKGYEDDEDEIDELEALESEFMLIDESDIMYGASPKDLIKEFGLIVSKELAVCGVDVRNMHYTKLDKVSEYLASKMCEGTEEGAMQILFLKSGDVLQETGIYVKGIEGTQMTYELQLANTIYS